MSSAPNSQPDPLHAATLIDHLTELRDRLVKCAYVILIATILCWVIREPLFDLVRAPIVKHLEGGKLIFTSPIDAFVAYLKLSFMGGIILSCPFWLHQVWQFVAPGLYANERKYGLMFIGSGVTLFLLGVLFVYFLVLPMAFGFLLNFAGEAAKPMITISEYMSFFVTTTLVFGGAFELPLVVVLLGIMGIVDQKFLRKNRRYAVVLLAFLSAIVTPPDALSMCMLLVPLWLFYEIAIIIVGWVHKPSSESGSLPE